MNATQIINPIALDQDLLTLKNYPEDYSEFIYTKRYALKSGGIIVEPEKLNPNLFDFQKAIVHLLLKMGRYCLFADTGLGKTLMSLSWGQALIDAGEVEHLIILAPLGVAKQTAEIESAKFGFKVNYCADFDDVRPGMNITNYERLDKFDASFFDAVICDESSILKSGDGAFCKAIKQAFKHTPYKLACTATPAPNDYMELAQQCEFLGVMSCEEMLSMFFIHDGGETQKWRLKGHAQQAFWEFVASWSIMVKKPSDIGFSDEGYMLPEKKFYPHLVSTQIDPPDGELVFTDVSSLPGQRHIRKSSCEDRCKIAADIIANDPDTTKQWLVWCETNPEGDLLEKLIPGSVQVAGSDSADFKEKSLSSFSAGKVRILITKPKIAGMGLNFQSCWNVIFVGVTNSFEYYYQAVRRVHRFGQKNEVQTHIVQHELEGRITENLKRKEKNAEKMGQEMIKFTRDISLRYLEEGTKRITTGYNPTIPIILPPWLVSED